MGRPIYENSKTLADEQNAFKRIESVIGVEIHKLTRAYKVDFLATKNKRGQFFGEFKKRDMVWGQYPSIVLALSKICVADSLKRSTGLNTLFFVEDKDGRITYTDLINDVVEREIFQAGRTAKTRDNGDIEPCVYIPNTCFRFLDAEDYQ